MDWEAQITLSSNCNKCDPNNYPLHLLSSIHLPPPTATHSLSKRGCHGLCLFVGRGWEGTQIFMCTSTLDLYLLPSAPLTRSCGFHNTVAAWLKQRSPRQVNNQPTQSAVCDRFHANKAFSNSLLRGSTRRGLSDCSLLITINL